MKKITLKIDCLLFFNNDIINYLLGLNGIKLVKINTESKEIYVEYDSNIISLKILKMEILLYLDVLNVPSIISFNKHLDGDLEKYIITIKDLCCEYCLKGMIEDLLEYDGIISAYSNFDYINNFNVNIYITYDSNLIKKEKLDELTVKLNNY